MNWPAGVSALRSGSSWRCCANQCSPFLLGGGLIYLLLGDLNEAVLLLAFAAISVAITVVQETRTERVLEALRDLASPRALVIRGGERRRIAGREVARGDLVVLAEGDRVPADALLKEAHDLQIDESLLTGESVPVRKLASCGLPASRARPGGRRPAHDLFRIAGGARRRDCRSCRHGAAKRDRQDRPISPWVKIRAAPPSGSDCTLGTV